MRITRRRFLALAGALWWEACRRPLLGAVSFEGRALRIGACDWSLGKMGRLEAFDVAKAIGLDGVQVSLGSAADDMKLRRREIQEAYLRKAKSSGVAIASLAIGELNRVPFKSDPRTVEWVRDSADAAARLGCRTILLAFFGKNDLRGDPDGRAETVRRLRQVAPSAEKAGVVFGIESWLSAEEHVELIDRVGSPAVKVYYDVANATKMGYDVGKEIRFLGKRGLLCECHMKENGALLGEGKVDFRAVRSALAAVRYSGWVQIEGARRKGLGLIPAYQKNLSFLKRLFGSSQ
ncbi:MAG: sugar phosphate isomerase/epimerase [Verrucomicrobia bacterium]|nr:sugar phosphate isomerase/epimerase [Verrucomicrobiota bacterium]